MNLLTNDRVREYSKIFEMCVLFVAVPTTLLLPIHHGIILFLILAAIGYATRLLIQDPEVTWKSLYQIDVRDFKSFIFLRVILFMIASTFLMWWLIPEKLFIVVWENPLLWVAMTIIYSLFSVYPQEILYRVFFYRRYRHLVSNQWLFLGLNAVIFCYAHVVFFNTLVFALTLGGGILFAYSYQRKGSIMLTTIEHSLYGWWLFTLGIGDMLAFPGP